MENSAYMPTSLASPALMVLASTAETRDALHLQGTPAFPGQTLDTKDMHIPFTASSFSMRPMYGQTDGFSSLPGHLLHLHSPFLTTSMERSLGFMNPGGAFRPVAPTTGTSEERNGFHSAFMPASKGPKLEQNVSSFSHSLNNDGSYSSPAGRSSPLAVKEESSDKDTSSSLDLQERLSETPASDITEGTERSTPEEGRTLRRSKKRALFDGQTPCCPVCGLSLRPGEIAAHFRLEELKLSKLSKVIKRNSKESTQSKAAQGSSSKKSKDSSSSGDKNSPESRWESYQRVKANRQNRLSARAKGKKRKQLDETTCPVCNERLTGTPEELNAHAEQCLRKREAEGDEDETVDVEGETYEEYEWAGQTRIRATTLLQGGFSASGFQTSSSRNIEDQDIDLNVDGDDTETYGQPQFNEADIIPCSVDEPLEDRERQALRGALVGSFPSKQPDIGSWTTQEGTFPGSSETDLSGPSYSGQNSDTSGTMLNLAVVIESLKSRIKELEDQNAATNKFKCLICMGPFLMPLISVSCWHVHCEECWLRTLGAKKLCPQCNMITSPQDLRRIYL